MDYGPDQIIGGIMDTNDFIGSVAQEDVVFITSTTTTSVAGANMSRLMIFIENTRFVADETAFIAAETGSTIKVATVTADTYSTVTKGLLKSWLYDFYANGCTQKVYLVACVDDIATTPADYTTVKTSLDAAYTLLKPYAYHKTLCICEGAVADGTDDSSLSTTLAVQLAKDCADDKQLLSSAPYYPFITTTPATISSDTLYAALIAAKADAFMTAYQDNSRNASLYSLGLTMSTVNSSGTVVANDIDFWASSYIASSGADGATLPYSTRENILKPAYICFFKPVGDNSGNVVAVGEQTILGSYIQADWCVAYITYMSKITIATYITQPNIRRTATTYQTILTILKTQLSLFGPSGSNRLSSVLITAPSYGDLPSSDADAFIITNAWTATYQARLHKVTVYGELEISE